MPLLLFLICFEFSLSHFSTHTEEVIISTSNLSLEMSKKSAIEMSLKRLIKKTMSSINITFMRGRTTRSNSRRQRHRHENGLCMSQASVRERRESRNKLNDVDKTFMNDAKSGFKILVHYIDPRFRGSNPHHMIRS